MRGWLRAAGAARRGGAVMATLVAAGALLADGTGITTRAASVADSVPAAPVGALLGEAWPLSASELTALEGGAPQVRTLTPATTETLAFAGIVRIDAPATRFVERFREIERFDAGKGIRRIRRFQTPPTLEDLAGLELSEKDRRSLRECAPGDCDVKLPAAGIARFQKEIDWNAADATTRANALARELLLGRLVAYQHDGDRALDPYNDRRTPLDTGQSFQAALAYAKPLATALPELAAYVRDFPRGTLPGAEDFFYWADVEFGLKSTLRLSHVTIYRAPPNPSGIAYAIVTKQLYASHYFHTTLEVRFLLDGGRGAEANGFYLVCWLDARSDGLNGILGPFIRLQARRKSRSGLNEYLLRVKRLVEAPMPRASARLASEAKGAAPLGPRGGEEAPTRRWHR